MCCEVLCCAVLCCALRCHCTFVCYTALPSGITGVGLSTVPGGRSVCLHCATSVTSRGACMLCVLCACHVCRTRHHPSPGAMHDTYDTCPGKQEQVPCVENSTYIQQYLHYTIHAAHTRHTSPATACIVQEALSNVFCCALVALHLDTGGQSTCSISPSQLPSAFNAMHAAPCHTYALLQHCLTLFKQVLREFEIDVDLGGNAVALHPPGHVQLGLCDTPGLVPIPLHLTKSESSWYTSPAVSVCMKQQATKVPATAPPDKTG